MTLAIDVLLCQDSDNVEGKPGLWPDKRVEVDDADPSTGENYIRMTPEEYRAYLIEKYPLYAEWIETVRLGQGE